jgi:F1F0 ATPase subunit 2
MTVPDLNLARDAAIGVGAGLLAGVTHFSSLWWNARLLLTHRTGKALALQLARLAFAAAGLAALGWLGAVPLLAGALGFLMGRQLLLHRFGHSQ